LIEVGDDVRQRSALTGIFDLSLAVVDESSELGVRLGIKGRTGDGWYPLSKVRVGRKP
jgi:hypothetical protein